MNSHKNARLTFVRRRELVESVENGTSRKVAAREFGVSVRTVAKWLARFRSEGIPGLYDRTSRPHSCPNEVSRDEAEMMLALRQASLVGQEIAAAVGRSRSTVSKVLRSARLSTQRQLERDPNPKRCEHELPGDMLHLDIKKLGTFKRPGHRFVKKTAGPYTASGTGWEHVHVCVDDHSRVAYVEVLDEGETGNATSAFLERAVNFFRAKGVKVKRILTDNGPGYRSRAFRKMAKRLGVKHSTTKPYTPRTNGKAERFIQTIQREWAYVRPYQSSRERRKALPKWVKRYNEKRPHGSLGGRPPITRR